MWQPLLSDTSVGSIAASLRVGQAEAGSRSSSWWCSECQVFCATQWGSSSKVLSSHADGLIWWSYRNAYRMTISASWLGAAELRETPCRSLWAERSSASTTSPWGGWFVLRLSLFASSVYPTLNLSASLSSEELECHCWMRCRTSWRYSRERRAIRQGQSHHGSLQYHRGGSRLSLTLFHICSLYSTVTVERSTWLHSHLVVHQQHQAVGLWGKRHAPWKEMSSKFRRAWRSHRASPSG